MIGIIGAMVPEVEALQQQIKNPHITKISGMEFWQGTLQGHPVVVAQCGVGKVFAALCAQTMILTFHPDVIINTGVAGGLYPTSQVLDIAVASCVVQHDMNTSALGDPIGLISGPNMVYFPADEKTANRLVEAAEHLHCPVITGPIASGDLFVSTPKQKNTIHNRFEAIACEMEGAAIGHTCHINQVPFGVLRVISDSATGDGAMEYTEFLPQAAHRSTQIILTCLEQLEELS